MLYLKRPRVKIYRSDLVWTALQIQRLEGSRFIRGGRYGISIGSCWKEEQLRGDPKLKFTDISMKSGSNGRLILTRGTPFFKAFTPEFFGIPDVACFTHAIASAAKRLRSSRLLGSKSGATILFHGRSNWAPSQLSMDHGVCTD